MVLSCYLGLNDDSLVLLADCLAEFSLLIHLIHSSGEEVVYGYFRFKVLISKCKAWASVFPLEVI